jgi:heme-degrading monooxygenase HmoA
MVLEVGLFDITPGAEAAFVAGFAEARPHLAGAPGCRSVRMTRGVESPSRFVLLVEWDSVAAHDAFRASEAFAGWRGPIAPHFAGPPVVEHFDDV